MFAERRGRGLDLDQVAPGGGSCGQRQVPERGDEAGPRHAPRTAVRSTTPYRARQAAAQREGGSGREFARGCAPANRLHVVRADFSAGRGGNRSGRLACRRAVAAMLRGDGNSQAKAPARSAATALDTTMAAQGHCVPEAPAGWLAGRRCWLRGRRGLHGLARRAARHRLALREQRHAPHHAVQRVLQTARTTVPPILRGSSASLSMARTTTWACLPCADERQRRSRGMARCKASREAEPGPEAGLQGTRDAQGTDRPYNFA